MRRFFFVLTLAVIGLLALPGTAVSAQPTPERGSAVLDAGYFYDELAPYGQWLDTAAHGRTWAPRVAADWRPYTRGQWVMTEQGWHWDSDEPFGWATFHYGRWIKDRQQWLWVPGTEWAPAWVSWRHGNGFAGWAPLPPGDSGPSQGYRAVAGSLGAGDYVFVYERTFLDRGLDQRLLASDRSELRLGATPDVTDYRVVDERIINGGIAVGSMERALGRPVPRARTVEVDRADAARARRASEAEVAVYRPLLRAARVLHEAPASPAYALAQPAVRIDAANGGTAFVHPADPADLGRREEVPSYTNAEVVSLDASRRTLVLRTAEGAEVTAELDDTLAGFGDVAAGDRVILTLRTGPGWARVTSIAKGDAPRVTATPAPRAATEPAAGPEARAAARAAFDTHVASLAQQAERVDRVWSEFRRSCAPQGVDAKAGARAWFALWEGSLRADLSGGLCRDLFNQVVALGEPIKEGMTAAEDLARHTLPPGDMREIRRRHAMDWGGWALPRPQTLEK